LVIGLRFLRGVFFFAGDFLTLAFFFGLAFCLLARFFFFFFAGDFLALAIGFVFLEAFCLLQRVWVFRGLPGPFFRRMFFLHTEHLASLAGLRRLRFLISFLLVRSIPWVNHR
jgi:hypothetical protein